MAVEVAQPCNLNEILNQDLPVIFRKQHLNRDVVIGFVGDRGGGKSLGGGLVATLDYMVQGEPCFSNVQLKSTMVVSEEHAAEYGQFPGSITYEANPLNKNKFLGFSPEYRGGVFFTHEFNIWLADARRSNSNLNLATDDVSQELRKLGSAWIYDCIHEMFVDVRVRDATDIFVQTSDTALEPLGMSRKQPQGLEFVWYLYAMTKKGAAILRTERYKDGAKPIGPIYVKGKQLWGLIDTDKREIREKYKPGQYSTEGIEITDTPEMVAAKSKYEWVYQKILELHDEGHEEIHSEELWEYLQLNERGISTVKAGQLMGQMDIKKRRAPPSQGGYIYLINNFDLKKERQPKRQAVVATT